MSAKTILFDLDGTLLNTLKTITHYVNRSLREIGADTISEETCRTMVGKGARNLLERALEEVNREVADFEAFFADYDRAYNAAPDYLTEPYAGICEILSVLKEKGMQIAVLSNKPEGAVRPLVEHFFGETVSAVFGGKDGVPLKPHPDAIAPVLAALLLSAEETAFIGDSGVDMQTAKNYGAAIGIGVTWGYRDAEELLSSGADALAHKPNEILSALGF